MWKLLSFLGIVAPLLIVIVGLTMIALAQEGGDPNLLGGDGARSGSGTVEDPFIIDGDYQECWAESGEESWQVQCP